LKNGVLENKNGNIYEMHKVTMEGLVTNTLSNGTIPDPLWPPLPQDWGLQHSYPFLSQEQVKLQTSNLAGTFTGPIRVKAH